jgi:dATP pyrophosphohydrolase
MARAPFQVHVLPYRFIGSEIEYAIFKRADAGYWQGIAGGGEDSESPLEAAKRETFEECGVSGEVRYIVLDSVTSIPVYHFKDSRLWGEDVYVIPQYSFGVNATGCELRLSAEHTEYKWLTYEGASELLYWHDNKTNLWELNQRLTKVSQKVHERYE